ncbi:phenylacetate--CoA ligase family protein [Kitasatospora aureofaciens]|uniref:phenylacetate--CoA ligase family protein n=1 Tax=Kitasatospora aureofaciens TaxID=1894 RepID=UPI001C47055D|nr:AMP-binding protein [Kitasatospora aureofaciens]MBV6702050.1 AMP-binding protein [Kitasatospora aureofaciens]
MTTDHRPPHLRYPEIREAALADLAAFEKLSPDQVPDHQFALLRRQLDHAFANSPFYRDTWAARYGSLRPADADALRALPFTTKKDMRAAYPFGLLAVGREELIRYGESTGTTGSPTSSVITYEDWIRGNVAVERSVAHVLGPGDLTFIAIPYELAFASYDLDRALEQVGAAVVPVGTLSLVCPFERMVEMMWTVHPSALVCTPSRALRLYDMLKDAGRDPAEVGLRTFLYVGETCSEAKLAKIAALWNVRLSNAYGSTETNSLGLVCERGSLHLTEDRHLFEVIDPETTEPVPDGSAGELVITSLSSRAMPLLRYRSGDFVTVSAEPCACGSPRRMLSHHGRVSEQLIVGGRRINKLALEQTVLATDGAGLYWAAGVRGDSLDIRVEAEGDDPAALCAAVADRVTAEFGVGATVAPIDRAQVRRAMDRMLKPGSLTVEDLEAVS